MLKIVVFDSGYGGELLADRLEAEFPVVEIVRVIDWRHAEQILKSPSMARKAAESAIHPYIGRVDLIIFANYLLSLTSLKYFRRKYCEQKFSGFSLRNEKILNNVNTLILSTKAVCKKFDHFCFAHGLHAKTAAFDTWPALIDDGELTAAQMKNDLATTVRPGEKVRQLILTCGQFVDIRDELRSYFGGNVRIIDGFDSVVREAGKALDLRGGLKKKK